MKLFIIIIVCAYVSGIRVPVRSEKELKLSAPYGQIKQIHFKNNLRSVSSVPSPSSSSHRFYNRDVYNNKGSSGNIRHHNPKRRTINSFLTPPPATTSIYHQTNLPYRNYRDDKLHEPYYQQQTYNNKANYPAPISQHEIPRDVPTKPLYPGEGKWAIKGIKHYPYQANIMYQKLPEFAKPDGHDIFENNQQVFANQQNQFAQQLSNLGQFNQNIKHKAREQNENNKEVKEKLNENNEEEVEEDEEADESPSGFIPLKTYSQVRNTESEVHLPRTIDDPRLREVVKDSKISTVYTEEGYEDSAYDHEGHEKNAENSEGYAESAKGKAKKPIKKFNNKRLQDFKKEIEEDASKVVDKYFSDEAEKKHKDKNENEYDENDSKKDGSNKIVIKKMVREKTNKIAEKHRRRKRFVNDFPQITADTDFIDRINLNLPHKTKQKPKYPYYNLNIHENSPLRYAEDLNNIPVKIEGEMSFYEQADKFECPEVDDDINPVPEDRIRQAEKEETGENENPPKTPRLGNLGDKIDCYKAKYFGEDPLDSPIFKEESIEQPQPIFENFERLITEAKPPFIAQLSGENISKEEKNNASVNNEDESEEKVDNTSSLNPKDDAEYLNRTDRIIEPLTSKELHFVDTFHENFKDNGSSESLEEPVSLFNLNSSQENSKENKAAFQAEDTHISEESRENVINNSSQVTDKSIENTEASKELQEAVKNNVREEKQSEELNEDGAKNKQLAEEFNKSVEHLKDSTVNEELKYNEKVIENHEKVYPDNDFVTPANSNENREEIAVVDHNFNSKEEIETLPKESLVNDTNKSNESLDQSPVNNSLSSKEETAEKVDYDESLEAYKTIDEDNIEPEERSVISYQITSTAQDDHGNKTNENVTTTSTQKTDNDIQNNTEISSGRNPKTTESIFNAQNETVIEKLPLQLPFRMYNRPLRPYIQPPSPTLNIFDINRFIPPITPIPFLPKYKTISEVYYKDDIKPSEQLNVFADVMNIIKNSSRDTTAAAEETEPVSIKLNTRKKEITTEYKPVRRRKKKPTSTTTESYLPQSQDLLKTYYQTSTSVPTQKTATQAVYDDFRERLKRYQNTSENNDNNLKTNKTQEQSKTHKYSPRDEFQPSVDVLGLTPPVEVVMIPKDQEVANTVNTFYIIGLKPPPKIRPIPYGDYKPLRSNKIRRKAVYPKRRRYKRETINSRTYAAISRQKDDKTQTEEEDDYEPNRQRSFHYDVKTGKIVYDKKIEEPPIEYEEIEEDEEEEKVDYGGLIPLKEPIPLSKKITTTEGPPGIDFSVDRRKEFNYVEFVNKLKSDKNYVAYPDPTTTEKSDITTSSAPLQKTTPPEFLNILTKIRSDNNYKQIKDKDDQKSKATTTIPEEVEEEEEEEEEPLVGVRNSPGAGQMLPLSNLEIFDISEYLPQVKSYTPRTNIDYSKYKSIDRSHTRPAPVETIETSTQSVLQTQATNLPLQESKEIEDNKSYASVQRYTPAHTTESSKITGDKSRETLPKRTTTKPPIVTTSRRRISVRNRTRGTTTTLKPQTTEEITTQAPIRHRKPTRVYPRRQHRVHIQTTHSPEITSDNVSKERVQRRVLDGNESIKVQIIPDNHKQFYTPIIVPENPTELLELKLESQLALPRIITPEIVAANLTNNTNITKSNLIHSDVEVFADYDSTRKHGGNYKKEPENVNNKFVPADVYEIESTTKLKQLVDVIPKPFAFYTNVKLPDKINQMKVNDRTNAEELTVNESENINKQYGIDDYSDEEGIAIKFENVNELSTKKPLFIKDPNKRLYFYAPL